MQKIRRSLRRVPCVPAYGHALITAVSIAALYAPLMKLHLEVYRLTD
jgi:hypothetical protein